MTATNDRPAVDRLVDAMFAGNLAAAGDMADEVVDDALLLAEFEHGDSGSSGGAA